MHVLSIDLSAVVVNERNGEQGKKDPGCIFCFGLGMGYWGLSWGFTL